MQLVFTFIYYIIHIQEAKLETFCKICNHSQAYEYINMYAYMHAYIHICVHMYVCECLQL